MIINSTNSLDSKNTNSTTDSPITNNVSDNIFHNNSGNELLDQLKGNLSDSNFTIVIDNILNNLTNPFSLTCFYEVENSTKAENCKKWFNVSFYIN